MVHGGERFRHSVLITDDVLRGIEDCIDLAPLHNPANIKGIKAAEEFLAGAYPKSPFLIPPFIRPCLNIRIFMRFPTSYIVATVYVGTGFTAPHTVMLLTAIDS